MTHFPLRELEKALTHLRARQPLAHCVTNDVVQDITANVLLAAGASPAMVVGMAEAAEFAAIADSVLINVGTLTEDSARVMEAAIKSANHAGKPWVLDPVAVGSLSHRTAFCREILHFKPAVIRGNASEILTLAGEKSKGRGVESGDSADSAFAAAKDIAIQTQGIVAVTGKVDYVTDGERAWSIPWGDALMTRVTGVGCALSALVAAFIVIDKNTLNATAAALSMMAIAGQHAAHITRRKKAGVGTFRVELLDALDLMNAETMEAWSHETPF